MNSELSRFHVPLTHWPQVHARLAPGFAKDLTLWLHQWASAHPHTQLHAENGPPLRCFESDEARQALWLSMNIAGQLLQKSGVLERAGAAAREGNYDLSVAIGCMDYPQRAMLGADLLRRAQGREEKADFLLPLDDRPRAAGRLSDAQLLLKVMEEKRDEEVIWMVPVVEGMRAALDELGPPSLTPVEQALAEAASGIRHCGDYGELWWHAERREACWVSGDADDPERGASSQQEILQLLSSVPGVEKVTVSDECAPTQWHFSHRESDGWLTVPHSARVINLS